MGQRLALSLVIAFTSRVGSAGDGSPAITQLANESFTEEPMIQHAGNVFKLSFANRTTTMFYVKIEEHSSTPFDQEESSHSLRGKCNMTRIKLSGANFNFLIVEILG
ncbi:hypothetical protein KIN20_027286 [Parelaphostrongylus tenuis]|uniref:Uncharacterized protein n=1 Tax=Parelaphostrongylus tenuis TaxID=148309 RepID=A0AAD5QZ63_PARTN|nr:hypothetical protein KIN20_027286 [Parelaphostrongylus tenuis]